jgi:hypothetical protein
MTTQNLNQKYSFHDALIEKLKGSKEHFSTMTNIGVSNAASTFGRKRYSCTGLTEMK